MYYSNWELVVLYNFTRLRRSAILLLHTIIVDVQCFSLLFWIREQREIIIISVTEKFVYLSQKKADGFLKKVPSKMYIYRVVMILLKISRFFFLSEVVFSVWSTHEIYSDRTRRGEEIEDSSGLKIWSSWFIFLM